MCFRSGNGSLFIDGGMKIENMCGRVARGYNILIDSAAPSARLAVPVSVKYLPCGAIRRREMGGRT